MELTRAVLDRLYLHEAGASWGVTLKAQAAGLKCGCGAQENARLAQAWRDAAGQADVVDLLADDVETIVRARASRNDLEAMMGFYGTPLGRKVQIAERPEPTPATPTGEAEQLAEFGRYQQVLDADPARKKVINELMVAMRAVDTLVDIMNGISKAASVGMMAVLPDDQRAASTPDIDTLIKQQQPLLRANFQTMLPLGYAKIYRNLSTAELESYLREARKPALQRFSKVYTSAFTAAMGKQAVGVGVAFGKALRASRI